MFVGLYAAANDRWKRIGTLPVEPFQFPLFRAANGPVRPGENDYWSLWDGQESHFIGKLPAELRRLEIELVWAAHLIEERIVSGRNPFGDAV